MVAALLLTGSVFLITVLTLTPTPVEASIPFWCVFCGERSAVDLLLNVALFVPLGVALGLFGLPLARAMLFAVLGTGVVETLQLFVIPGRYPTFRDILANSLGAFVGYLVGRHWRQIIAPDFFAARRLVIVVGIAWLASQGFMAWAMGASPPSPPWWAQLKPEHDRYPSVFTDDIVGVSIGSVRIRESDVLVDASAIRDQLLAGAPLRVLLTDVQPRSMAPIAIISAGEVHDVVRWQQDGRDGVFAATVRGSLLGLRTPSVRIADVFPVPSATRSY